MNDGPGSDLTRASRRRILRTAGGLTALGAFGVGASSTVAAEPGDQQWSFDIGDTIRSSPSVADGTVFVGADDSHLYAVEADTGD